MRVDPFARHRELRPIQKVEALQPADDRNAEATVVLYLRKQDNPDAYRAQGLTRRLARTYVLAEDRVDFPVDGEEESPGFPPVGGEAVRVSEDLCRDAATIFTMQPMVDADGRDLTEGEIYSPEMLIAMSASMESAWGQIRLKAALINQGVDLGKAFPASLESASPTAPDTTPSS